MLQDRRLALYNVQVDEKREREIIAVMLRELREGARFSQRDMAEKMGVQQTVVSRWERGERRVDLIEIKAICNAVGLDVHQFVGKFLERTANE